MIRKDLHKIPSPRYFRIGSLGFLDPGNKGLGLPYVRFLDWTSSWHTSALDMATLYYANRNKAQMTNYAISQPDK